MNIEYGPKCALPSRTVGSARWRHAITALRRDAAGPGPAADEVERGETGVHPGEVAALIAAGAFVMLVLVLAVPILRLRHTVDAATRAINDLTDQTSPLLGDVDATVKGVNEALGQVHTTLDGVNLQLERLDAITSHAQTVTANVANLSTVVTSAASSPLVRAASLTYGVRKALANRRKADEEAEVRARLKEQRRAARRGSR
jgi:uncharacterized protein YoxC